MVREILPSLKAKGRPDLGWLGVDAQAVTPEIAEALKMPDPIGAIVRGVTKGGPADKAGLQRGDVIVELDGKKVLVAAEIPRMVAFGHIGKTVTFTVLRQGKSLEIKAVVAAMPEK
jgi:S1-C subfamily serine protease